MNHEEKKCYFKVPFRFEKCSLYLRYVNGREEKLMGIERWWQLNVSARVINNVWYKIFGRYLINVFHERGQSVRIKNGTCKLSLSIINQFSAFASPEVLLYFYLGAINDINKFWFGRAGEYALCYSFFVINTMKPNKIVF